MKVRGLNGAYVSINSPAEVGRFGWRDVSRGNSLQEGAGGAWKVGGRFYLGQIEDDGPILPSWRKPVQAHAQGLRIAFKSQFDHLASDCLCLAFEDGFQG
ncbi:hypothetical protein ASF49_22100 [Methylobacterium sp. Leaf104]|nr:hypothetical protein ASF49_22100 [Methylobacterium sp. Leaf104]